MQVRFSPCRGMPVIEEQEMSVVAFLEDILIHPDTGAVEGFFVRPQHRLLQGGTAFLLAQDIRRFTHRAYVRDPDVVIAIEELYRLQALLREPRPILGQNIQTEAGETIGKCGDVQFDTQQFVMTWLFPRRFLRWKTPLPASSIVEVRPEAIIVRTLVVEEEEKPSIILPVSEPA